MKELGLIINLRKPEAVKMSKKIMVWAKNNGCEILLPHQEASALTTTGLDDEQWLKTVKLALVIGGDGTFLRAARYIMGTEIILHGVNMGHLGFLASTKPDEIENDLEKIINDDFEVIERRVLSSVLYHDNDESPSHKIYALNDIVLTTNAIARLVQIEIKFNGKMRIISEPDKGLYFAMNKGISMATGEIIGIINKYATKNLLIIIIIMMKWIQLLMKKNLIKFFHIYY